MAAAALLAPVIAAQAVLPASASDARPAHGSQGRADTPLGADPTGIGDPFAEHNGIMWEYVRDPEGFDGFGYPATTYASITQKITSGWYSSRGIHHLAIYGAWKSTPEFLGLPPLDYFDTQVGTGSVTDFRDMTKAANAKGMTVIMYMELLYIHPDNPVFVKAATDRAAGIDSYESRLFRWDERPQPQAECPADPLSSWAATWVSHPDVANGRCYVQSWGHWAGVEKGLPAFDYSRPEALDYAKKVLRFWLGLGVQGFTYDAPQTYLDLSEAGQTELQITLPTTFRYRDGKTRPQWFDAEGQGTRENMRLADRVGYSVIYGDAGDDWNSAATQVARDPQGLTIDQLDDHYATWLDPRRMNGRGAWGTTVFDFDQTSMPPALRALDAAVQAGGAGMTYFNHQQTLNQYLPAADEKAFYDVFRAIDRSPALAPGASRERLVTQTDPKAYALLKRSMDGRTAALALYNFSSQPMCITVDLAGTGVSLSQRTTDLGANAPGPWIRGEETTFSLPGYGYRFLDVEADAGFPWRLVDTDAGWRAGGGWQVVADPSAQGGSRIGGNAVGGFAQYAFTGASAQLWGLKTTAGSDQVRVTIDGVDRGVHSQRRTSPIPDAGGDAFYGQLLASFTGLGKGRHVLRVEQVGAAGPEGAGAGIDYLRVSDRVAASPVVTGGDRCASDTAAPTTTATAVRAGKDTSIVLRAVDDSSGVAAIQYRLDGGRWSEYTGPVEVDRPGTHAVSFRSTDVAGNEEAARTLQVTVDRDRGDRRDADRRDGHRHDDHQHDDRRDGGNRR
ncbi:hypothetical protein GCM10009739_01390 [Microbacterium ulmi]